MAKVGRVYLIFNDDDDKVYVGSSWSMLFRRLIGHKGAAIYPGAAAYPSPVATHYRAIGVDKMRIELLERRVFADRDDMRWAERHWMELYQELGFEVLNDRVPIRSAAEKLAYRNTYNAMHRKTEAYQISAQRWADANREYVSAQRKVRYRQRRAAAQPA